MCLKELTPSTSLRKTYRYHRVGFVKGVSICKLPRLVSYRMRRHTRYLVTCGSTLGCCATVIHTFQSQYFGALWLQLMTYLGKVDAWEMWDEMIRTPYAHCSDWSMKCVVAVALDWPVLALTQFLAKSNSGFVWLTIAAIACGWMIWWLTIHCVIYV